MKITWQVNGHVWKLEMELSSDDVLQGGGQGTMSVGLLERHFHIKLPSAIDLPHPDLTALVALVTTKPWVTSTLVVDRAVSKAFAELVFKLFRIKISPISETLEPRASGSVPVLSYSGGVDSVAASQVLPSGIPHVHFKRIDHDKIRNRAPHVMTEAIADVVSETGKRGYEVHIVETDLEHICHPYPTLPHWFAITVGVLLMADELDAGAIALGGTLETFYMDMGRKWTGEGGKGLEPLSEIVGLPFIRPMLGITEIGTMLIAAASNLGDIARSCVLGTRAKPCGVCVKCVRKILTSAAISDSKKVPQELMLLRQEDPGVKALQSELPLYMQAQLEYSLARITELPKPLEELYLRLGEPEQVQTSWMERYYLSAINRSVPAPWRESVLTNILKYLPLMDDQHLKDAVSWDRTK